jgi:flagellar FliL protein
MADEDQIEEGAEEAASSPGSSKRKLFMIAGAVLLAVIVGAGAWFVFFRDHGGEQHAEAAPPAKPPVFLDVPEILVNLAANPGDRIQYLKVKAVLEVKEAPLVEKIQPAMPRITDLFQVYLRELRSSDLNGSIGLFRMKEELTKRVNAAISPNQVNAVLFKEVVIQ